jgi:hypothetical protein
MTIFALVWSSIANPKAVAKLSIQSAEDMIIVVLGALIVIGVLWCINLIPSKYVTTHISLLSSLLYTALFLTYGRGFGLVSNSMLLGVLIYLTFGLGKFAGLALRVVIYDIDPQIADELEELQKHTQEAKLQRETTGIREQALKAKSESLEERGRSSQIQVDEFLLDTLHTKLERLMKTFSLLSSQLSKQYDNNIKKDILELEESAQNLNPENHEELSKKVGIIIARINSASSNIPQQLQGIRDQIIEAYREYQEELHALEEGQKALLEAQTQPEQRQRTNLLDVSINACFGRINNVILHQPGINRTTRDKVLQSSASAQKAIISAQSRSESHDIIKQWLNYFDDFLDSIIDTEEVAEESLEGRVLVDRSEALVQELDADLKRCVRDLQYLSHE